MAPIDNDAGSVVNTNRTSLIVSSHNTIRMIRAEWEYEEKNTLGTAQWWWWRWDEKEFIRFLHLHALR
jgi:hypothetical protein